MANLNSFHDKNGDIDIKEFEDDELMEEDEAQMRFEQGYLTPSQEKQMIDDFVDEYGEEALDYAFGAGSTDRYYNRRW